METVSVKTPSSNYDVFIGSSIYGKIPEIMNSIRLPSTAVIITSRILPEEYARQIESILKAAGIDTETIVIRAGESNKSLKTVYRIYESLAEMAIDRHAAIVPVGGGVVCDIGGFVAATYLRGIQLYQVPTTLLAQVDASVGGKNGVDLPQGKNLVGTFYQPSAVIADVASLKTLPARELRNGIAEVVKHGVVCDEDYFKYVRSSASYISPKNHEEMIKVVRRSVEIKADVVAKDELDQGIRGILNFGHTIGHALETLTKYKSIRHGEAVAIGMVSEAIIAEKMKICPEGVSEEIANMAIGLRLPVQLPRDIPVEQIVQAMNYDKKMISGKLRMALPTRIGHAAIVESIPREVVAEALETQKNMDFPASLSR